MSTIPISLTEEPFNEQINPYLSKAKRGDVCSIPLYKVFNYMRVITTMLTISSRTCKPSSARSSNKAYPSEAPTSMPTALSIPKKLAKPVSTMA